MICSFHSRVWFWCRETPTFI